MATKDGPGFAFMRRINFTHSEKLMLLNLVEKYRSYIIDNINDGGPWRRKSDVWEEIAQEYNIASEDGMQRDGKQLKKCWENMKTRFRKANPACVRPTEVLLQENKAHAEIPIPDESAVEERMAALVSRNGNRESITAPFLVTPSQLSHNSGKVVPCIREKSPTIEIMDEDYSQQKINLPANDTKPSILQADSQQTFSCPTSMPGPDSNDNAFVLATTKGHDDNGTITSSTLTSPNNYLSHSSFSRKRQLSQRTLSQQNGVRSGNGGPPPRFYGKLTSSISKQRPLFSQRPTHGQSRNTSALDAEKVLRVRLLRTKIREQETRIHMMQQRMRQERERHEAALLLLRKKTDHYEAQTESLRTMLPDDVNNVFGDDDDLCEDSTYDAIQ
ncbi:unnamed protein product [Clavelina lepadiformis]|uniref:Myb-like domain-containing protein n=1 Tax=Clavelina lepadiformis TaxID=159417 RepID=A0ABP0GKM3_CLALP